MNLPKAVKLVEVGPRDGLQNERLFVSTEQKIKLINHLIAAGMRHIEVGSFVSSRKIPQLRDVNEVLAGLSHNPQVTYSALVPNMIGLAAAHAAGMTEIAVFGAVSEAFVQHNINCSVAESLVRFQQVIEAATQHNIRVRGYISCSIACPYSGPAAPDKVALLAEKLLTMGCYEIALGDTIGVGTPRQINVLIDHVAQKIPINQVAMHFHDTYGQALANIYASLLKGVAVFDCSVSGLGGCPYAKTATGNVASEEVVYLLDGLGIETGVDLDKLVTAGQFINGILDRNPQSKVAQARL